MRHFIWIAVLYAACNNTASTNQPANRISAAIAEETPATGPAACNKLVFFQPGAEIKTRSYDATGKLMGSQVTKIKEVKNEGGMSVAYVEASDTITFDKHITNMKYNYKCDGKSIYFDLASLLHSTAPEGNTSFEGSVMEYPIAITAGQTLPDATGTMKMEKNGKTTTMKYHYKDRKVTGMENVTTPAGTWNCFRITNGVDVEVDFPGMSDKAKKMMANMTNQMKSTGITWFSPDLGIVKMELYQNGKLVSKNEIVSVKK